MSKDTSGLFPGKNMKETLTSGYVYKSGDHIAYIYKNPSNAVAHMIVPRLPKNPQVLVKNGWEETTPPEMSNNTNSQTFHDPVTNLDIRFDKGEKGVPGFGGKDHYHIENPDSTGKHDKYLDKDGNPCAKNSKASHILPTEEG